ncbi:MAG: LPP20 family lipoprotein [Deltaproteobacteria bacterium]|nr:LPP20 family lipoprotein [Deltaproteobacteria bacterium]MCD6265958.1 LPP20 family lipoprotein [Deltaproteobacteria bacterium]
MRETRIYVSLVIFFVIMIAGCAAKKEIPAEAIQGRAEHAFDELKSEETGGKAFPKVKRGEKTTLAQPSEETRGKVQVKKGKRPGWVDGDSIQYPSSKYLTGVGYDPDRKLAEDKARAEIAKIFVSKIDSRTRTYQDYLKITSKGRSKTEEIFSIQDITSVSTQKVLSGVRIAQVYQETGTRPIFYALAVLDRDQSAKILGYKIQELDQDIHQLLSRAKGEEDLLAKVKCLKQSVQKFVIREAYDTELRIVSRTGKGISSSIHFAEIKGRLESILLRDFLIGVSVKGSRADEVQDALVQGLNQQGFSISQDLNRVNVLVRGNVEIKPLKRGTSEWKYVQWRAYFDMVDKKCGSVFGSVNKTGRQGHLSLQQAENRAVRNIRKVLITEIAGEMKRYIFSQ